MPLNLVLFVLTLLFFPGGGSFRSFFFFGAAFSLLAAAAPASFPLTGALSGRAVLQPTQKSVAKTVKRTAIVTIPSRALTGFIGTYRITRTSIVPGRKTVSFHSYTKVETATADDFQWRFGIFAHGRPLKKASHASSEGGMEPPLGGSFNAGRLGVPGTGRSGGNGAGTGTGRPGCPGGCLPKSREPRGFEPESVALLLRTGRSVGRQSPREHDHRRRRSSDLGDSESKRGRRGLPGHRLADRELATARAGRC